MTIPDGFPTNADRADRAASALRAFDEFVGENTLDDPACLLEVAVDLVADLLHLCERSGVIDVEEVLKIGLGHYRFESGSR